MMVFSKNCPKCGKLILYKNKYRLADSIKHNRCCNKCENNPMYNISAYDKLVEKYGKDIADLIQYMKKNLNNI